MNTWADSCSWEWVVDRNREIWIIRTRGSNNLYSRKWIDAIKIDILLLWKPDTQINSVQLTIKNNLHSSAFDALGRLVFLKVIHTTPRLTSLKILKKNDDDFKIPEESSTFSSFNFFVFPLSISNCSFEIILPALAADAARSRWSKLLVFPSHRLTLILD